MSLLQIDDCPWRPMDLRHLRHFIAVAEELHFARAAERLGMEQSPLSHSIRNLEGELKTKLFHRTTRQTRLTREGARFYVDAKRILNDIEAATASLLVGRENQPDRVRLALGEDLAGEPFTRLLSELENRQPAALIEVRELAHGEAAKLVRDGGADVGLTLDSRAVDGLTRVRGWGEPLMLVVPMGHPLAGRDRIEFGEIAAERLALPQASICPGYLAQIELLLKQYQVRVAERVVVRHWNTAVSFASAGRALALVPASFINGATAIVVVPVSQPTVELVTWILYRDEPSSAVSLVLRIAEGIDAGPTPPDVRAEA